MLQCHIAPFAIHRDGQICMTKWVYAFGDGKAEGRADMRDLLGGKGANLAEMSNLGLPVPPGLTITTEVCTYYYANGQTYPSDLKVQVDAALAEIGRIAGGTLGDPARPLLLSVRSATIPRCARRSCRYSARALMTRPSRRGGRSAA